MTWNPLAFRCPYCSREITTWIGYAVHLRKHRGTPPAPVGKEDM